MERVALILNDMKDSSILTDEQLYELVSEIDSRRKKSAHVHESNDDSEEILEAISMSKEAVGKSIEVMASAAKVAQAAKSLSDSFEQAGQIGAIVSNVISLLATPVLCIKEKRWPNQDELIKLGFCVVAIPLAAIAFAIPGTAVALGIAAAAVALVRNIYKNYSKLEEISGLEKLLHSQQDEIKRLSKEIEDLSADNIERQVKENELTAVVDKYVLNGHKLHYLKQEFTHPVKAISNAIFTASSVVALAGVIVSLAFPPVGITLTLVAGAVSLLTLGVSAATKWYNNRQNQVMQTPGASFSAVENNDAHKECGPSLVQEVAEPHLSSTASELQALEAASKITRKDGNVASTASFINVPVIGLTEEGVALHAPPSELTKQPELVLMSDVQLVEDSVKGMLQNYSHQIDSEIKDEFESGPESESESEDGGVTKKLM